MTDDAPSQAELIEIPPDRVTLAWCTWCGVLDTWAPSACPNCGADRTALTYAWVDDE